MANKTREEAMKTRELIIDTALRVIRRDGYERATLLNIAAEAGMTRGAVYGNFKNKAELFSCILRNWCLPQKLISEISDTGTLSEQCCKILERFETDALYRIVYSLVTTSVRSEHDISALSPEIGVAYKQILQVFEEFLREGQRRGDVSKRQDTAEASVVLLSYLIGLGKIWSVEQSKFPLIEWAQGFVEIFLRGLRQE